MGPGSRGGGLNGDGSIQRHPWLKMSIEFEALDHVGLNEGIQRDKAFISFSINKAMVKLSRSCLLAELSLHEAMFKGRQKESGRTTLLSGVGNACWFDSCKNDRNDVLWPQTDQESQTHEGGGEHHSFFVVHIRSFGL